MSKILVIGDSCIDIFKYGEVNRLAPEAPIPIIVPETEKSNPGMAGNVVENLKYFEQREMYEECGKIHKAIEVLSKSEK